MKISFSNLPIATDFIRCIKLYRILTRSGLKDAKDYIESIRAQGKSEFTIDSNGGNFSTLARAVDTLAEYERTAWDIFHNKNIVVRIVPEDPRPLQKIIDEQSVAIHDLQNEIDRLRARLEDSEAKYNDLKMRHQQQSIKSILIDNGGIEVTFANGVTLNSNATRISFE